MKTRMRSWCLAATVLVLSTVACAQNQSKTVAIVNGESISEEQVQKAANAELESLDQKRQQFMVNLERDKTKAVAGALDEIVNEKLLTAEAKKRNISIDELVRQEVQSKVAVPSDDAVRKFYDDNKAVINGSFVEVALQIRNYLVQQSRERAFAALLFKLRGDYGFKSMLEPYRTTVTSEGHPSRGAAAAPVTIVEFSDFECPYCGGLFPTLKRIEEDYKDKIRIVYRQFPLTNIHPNAQKAAEASLCANEQDKFWQFHDAMFSDQNKLAVDDLKATAAALSLNPQTFSTCLDSGKYAVAIRDSIAEGAKAGVDGTPALFINGRFLGGNQPYEEIVKVIDDELLRLGK